MICVISNFSYSVQLESFTIKGREELNLIYLKEFVQVVVLHELFNREL